MDVIWKNIVGIMGVPDDKFAVSNTGEVINLHTGTILSKRISNKGYYLVTLRNRPMSVHKLVAIYHVPGKSSERDEVNHKDGCKLNNYATNLEWMTRGENIIHAYTTGLLKPVTGEDCHFATIPISDVDTICSLLIETNGDTREVVKRCEAKGIKASYQMVQQIKHKQSWKRVSDTWFDDSKFKVRHLTESDVERICELLVKYNGDVPSVMKDIWDDIPHLRKSQVYSIKMKLSHVKTSDRYFEHAFI